MIALLISWGLGKTVARLIAYVGAPLLIIGALWLALHLYGNSRYNEGVADTDAKWELAKKKLEDEAAKSATRADDRAAERLEMHLEQAAEEQEAINDAIENGASPFDVLFHP